MLMAERLNAARETRSSITRARDPLAFVDSCALSIPIGAVRLK